MANSIEFKKSIIEFLVIDAKTIIYKNKLTLAETCELDLREYLDHATKNFLKEFKAYNRSTEYLILSTNLFDEYKVNFRHFVHVWIHGAIEQKQKVLHEETLRKAKIKIKAMLCPGFFPFC